MFFKKTQFGCSILIDPPRSFIPKLVHISCRQLADFNQNGISLFSSFMNAANTSNAFLQNSLIM